MIFNFLSHPGRGNYRVVPSCLPELRVTDVPFQIEAFKNTNAHTLFVKVKALPPVLHGK